MEKIKLNNGLSTGFIDVYDSYFEKLNIDTVRKYGYHGREYLRKFISYDSETSHNHATEHDKRLAWVYQWSFFFFNGVCVGGRKPSEFIAQLLMISDMYNLSTDKRCVIYIHNLSYDITFLLDFMYMIDEVEILALDSHKFLTVYWHGFEFRCSWKLSNMSLDMFSESVNTINKKMLGAIDYDAIRYQDSILTRTDWEYQVNDVITLDESLTKKLTLEHDTVATVPLTATGYVRRECRRAVRGCKEFRDNFVKYKLDADSYIRCRQAFAGGYTHGNRFMSGKIIE
ncbi:MAG: hypothetical protein J5993_06275 [Clostridia bacterium]|nr:hypothetical protein [Clostridia bacterium]